LGEINNDEKTIKLNKLKPIFMIFEICPKKNGVLGQKLGYDSDHV